jgi:hypothetical protein
MKFTLALAALATIFTTINACKCGGNLEATKACCQSTGGVATSDDCPANQISERLSNFASCCNNLGARSDCRCPVGCARNETDAARAAEGLEPLSNEEVFKLVESYGGLDD